MNRVLRFGVSASLIGVVFMKAATAFPADEVAPGDLAAPSGKVPEHTIIVKGAWPSATDSTTPLPEGGRLSDGSYQNEYFGLTLPYSPRWQPGLDGPPPSDSGSYVLAQIVPGDSFKAEKPGHLLITAQDIFFAATQANSALELINFTKDHLDRSVYRIEEVPREVQLARHAFIRFGYLSPIASLHWIVLAIEIRCHIVEFVFVSTNRKKLSDLLKAMDMIRLPSTAGVHSGSGGGEVPVCIKDYASGDNIIEREEPILSEPRYNPIPVRIIIDERGKVKYLHFLRAFPDQAKTITDALLRWRFKPHLVDGKPVEVETGIMFGRRTQQLAPTVAPGASRESAAPGADSYEVNSRCAGASLCMARGALAATINLEAHAVASMTIVSKSPISRAPTLTP